MSPTRPRLTTRTEVTSVNPMNIHRKYEVFDGTSGSSLMPRNSAGSEISRIDWLIVTIKIPSVVLDKAIHLYGTLLPPPPAVAACPAARMCRPHLLPTIRNAPMAILSDLDVNVRVRLTRRSARGGWPGGSAAGRHRGRLGCSAWVHGLAARTARWRATSGSSRPLGASLR